MRCIRNADLMNINQPSVATIGTFDGVHVGHQQVLKNLKIKALELGLPATVICFEPQPKEFFMDGRAPARITPFRDRMQAFKSCGIDQVLCLQFDKKLSALSAEAFILKILVEALHVKYLVVGDDFHFGSDRKGDFNLLKQKGVKFGYEVAATQTLAVEERRVSSSVIRQLIQNHKFDEVNQYLGRPYSLQGRVHHGVKKGRTIGFPTINLPLPVKVVVSGVYIVKVLVSAEMQSVYYGIANVGVRPTICGVRRLLEVHLYDFSGDLYGKHVEVIFMKHVRDEQKFDSFPDLAAQINKDKQYGERWLKEANF